MTLARIPRYDSDRVPDRGSHAVVVGAGMAGLLAARVLSDAFSAVTVIERDPLAAETAPRRGVPQGNHIHSLWEGGRATIEDLFPGFSDKLLARGAVLIEVGQEYHFYSKGDFLTSGLNDLKMVFATRPLYERVVRRRLEAAAEVRIRSGCQFIDFIFDDEAMVVTGVRIRNEEGVAEAVAGDVVIDATGRTSRTSAWLEHHGYPTPPLEEVAVDLAYSSTFVERPADDRRAFGFLPDAPRTRGSLVFPVEGDRWLVTLMGMHGDHPPSDADGFRAFAASLPTGAVADLLDEHAIPTGDIVRYPFPTSRRYRYEDLDAFPDGLVVVGDAIASYNPVYGQGMSVAAFHALQLHHALATGGSVGLAPRFFDRASGITDIAWTMAVGSDFAFPQTEGKRPRGTTFVNWYLDRLLRRAHTDGRLTDAFLLAASLQHPPSVLFRPGVILRVLGPSRRAKKPTPREPSRSD